MAPKTPATQSGKPSTSEEPKTIFQYERQRRGLELTEGSISDTIPRLPATSPWSVGIDQVSSPEPSIDRSSDGDIFIEEK
jgi:hypothetical protein